MNTKKWIIVTILLAILATALQLAGFVTPMWIWLDIGDFQVGVGLWYTTGCGIGGTCNTTEPVLSFGYSSDDTHKKVEFIVVQVLQSLGLAAGILVVLFLVVYRIGFGVWEQMGQLNIAAFVTCILGWLCILAGIIVYSVAYQAVVGTSPLHSTRSFPWSFLMCLLADALFIIITVLIRIKCRDRDFLKHAIPTSGDSKMDLNPVTTHGLQHSYFTPLNYNEDRRNHMGFGMVDERIQKHLIGSEKHHMTGVDNLAFQGNNTTETGVSYRYLSNGMQNGGVVHNSETVVKRTLPTAVVTYNDEDHHHHHNNLNATNSHLHHHQRGFSDTRAETVNRTAYTSNIFNTTTANHHHHNHNQRFSNSSSNAYNDNRHLLRRSASTGSEGRQRDSFNAYNDDRRGLVRSGSTGSLVQGRGGGGGGGGEIRRNYSTEYTTVVRRQNHVNNDAYQAYAGENRGLVRSSSVDSLRQQRGRETGRDRYQDYEGRSSSARQAYYSDDYGRGLVRSGSVGSLVQDGGGGGGGGGDGGGRMQDFRNLNRVSSTANAFSSELQSSNRRGLVRSASFGSQGYGLGRAGRQRLYRQTSADDAQQFDARRGFNDGMYYQENRVTREAFGHQDDSGGGYTTVTRPVSYVTTRSEIRQKDGSQFRGHGLKSVADAGVNEDVLTGDDRGLRQMTTHTRLGRSTTLASRHYPVGSSVKLYDPTYIYRPYSEQIY